MLIKQLSIFVENKAGRLAEITEIIAKAGIDIRALSIADTTNFGILRLIVDKPDEAEKPLKTPGLQFRSHKCDCNRNSRQAGVFQAP